MSRTVAVTQIVNISNLQHGDDRVGTLQFSVLWNVRYNTEWALCKGDDIFPEQYASTPLTEGGH